MTLQHLNTYTIAVYNLGANDFIGELKSLRGEINSKFTKKPRFIVIEDDNKILSVFAENVNFCSWPPLQVSLKTMNCFLNRIIDIAENPKCFLRVENNEPSQECYSKLWEAWRSQQKTLTNAIKSISFYIRNNKEHEIAITNPAKEETILDSNSVDNLEKNLAIFIKRSKAYCDFYKPPFRKTNTNIASKRNKKISRAEEIRKLLAKNHVKIIYSLKKPPLVSTISKPNNQEKETPQFLFNVTKSSFHSEENYEQI